MSWAERLIGRLLAGASARSRAQSPRAGSLLAQLQGRRLAIFVGGTAWAERPILITSSGQALQLCDDVSEADAPPADAVIAGAPLSLLSLIGEDAEAAIRRGDVRIDGDAQLAREFRELGSLLLPDAEQELSRLVGRSAAHLLVGAARSASAAARTAAETSVRNVAEYLAHESGDLVSRREAEHFLQGVERAREQLDRLDARLSQLEQRAGVLAGGAGPR